jgi:hypothetical protein
MAERRNILKPIVFFVCVAATIAGLVNVYGDNVAVRRSAEAAACGKANCSVTMTREARSPFSQSFTFQTSLQGQQTVDVECKREHVLVGDYSCTKQ